MSELTLAEDAVKTAYFAGLLHGAASVRRADVLWAPDMIRDPELDAMFSSAEKEILYGAIRDILAGRVPSPFASPGPVTP